MRRFLLVLLLLGSLSLRAEEASTAGRIVKTLPLLQNTNGQVALSPSLFDRDAYQAYLLQHTNEISGIRFDILWKAKKSADAQWKLKLELRGVGPDGLPRLQTLEAPIKPAAFRHWTSLTLGGEDYRNFGQIVAWRTTLWRDDVQISEQKSFLW